MSTATEKTKPSNKETCLKHIGSILSKYKIVKLPVMIGNVVKATFGDLSKEEERADKAFTLVAGLINELIEKGEITSFTFARQTTDGDKPVLLKEIVLVETGFEIVGYQPLNIEVSDEQTSNTEEVDDDDVFNDDDDEDSAIDGVNKLIENSASGYAIITMERDGSKLNRNVVLRSDPIAALGKLLELAGQEKNPELFALISVDLQVSSMAGKPVNVDDTAEDEIEAAS